MSWVLVSAGEVSGDAIAAPVIAEMRRRHPRLRFFGAGGERLAAMGMEIRHAASNLAVTGVTEAIGRSGGVMRLLCDTALQIRRRRPCLGLLVDYPGANLRLAWMLHRLRIPVLYYVAPQRWAWLRGRTDALRRAVDHLAVTLPFEEDWFRRRGVAATFVGHPLLDLFRLVPRDEARARLGVTSECVVALLPGSREHEIRRHLPLLLRTMNRLPVDVRPVLAALPGEMSRLCLHIAPELPRCETACALGAADVALCASGSATLEVALAGVPAAVFYRLSPLSYLLGRLLVRVPWIALPNLILGRELLPELIQDRMTPEALAAAVDALRDEEQRRVIRLGYARVVERLGAPGAASRVADLADRLLER